MFKNKQYGKFGGNSPWGPPPVVIIIPLTIFITLGSGLFVFYKFEQELGTAGSVLVSIPLAIGLGYIFLKLSLLIVGLILSLFK
ncbi:MAG: hypothetical protein QE271_11585 [Bacteriovoracaceae bacterium]|nr:hypothetical protein [Bacteriovoracaceae bacterium]